MCSSEQMAIGALKGSTDNFRGSEDVNMGMTHSHAHAVCTVVEVHSSSSSSSSSSVANISGPACAALAVNRSYSVRQ